MKVEVIAKQLTIEKMAVITFTASHGEIWFSGSIAIPVDEANACESNQELESLVSTRLRKIYESE